MKTITNPFEQIVAEITDLRSILTEINSEKEQIVRQNSNSLLTCEEVLKLFHISRPTLRRWEKDKKLTPIRLGRRMLFRQSDIDSAIEKIKSKGQIG